MNFKTPSLVKFIKNFQKEKGLTNEELACFMGFKGYQNITNMKIRKDVPIKRLKRLSKKLNIEADVIADLVALDAREAILKTLRT